MSFDENSPPLTVVYTQDEFTVTARPRPREPEDDQTCVEIYIGDTKLTERYMSVDEWERQHVHAVFAKPRRIGIVAYRTNDDFTGMVTLLLPTEDSTVDADAFEMLNFTGEEDEEEEVHSDDEELPFRFFVLGSIHAPLPESEDLDQHEALRMLSDALFHGILTPEQRAIDDLLSSK